MHKLPTLSNPDRVNKNPVAYVVSLIADKVAQISKKGYLQWIMSILGWAISGRQLAKIESVFAHVNYCAHGME